MEGIQAGCATKLDNHLDIDMAISDIDSLIAHAEELLSRINGTLVGKNEQSDPTPDKTLSYVLSSSAGTIRDKSSKLHDILNQISDSLF